MASGGGGGAGVCNKRYRRSADDDDGETSGRNKRCSVGPSSGAIDDGESGDFYDGAGGEDYMYGYDDDFYDDEEAEQSEGDVAASACDDGAEQRYVVLAESDVRARQEADTAKVAEVLSIPPGFAAVLLRHFKWRVGRVQEEWFTDDRRVRGAVGLPAPADGDEALVLVPDARSPRPQVCGICFDPFPAGRTRSAGCSHYYCDGCWGGYVAAAVGDGARCLSLRCPDPSCPAPVVRELVDAVAAGAAEVRARYARFWLRSYVEESGGCIKWCGGAGCTRSVEFLGDAAGADADTAAATDVFCGGGCRHGFCWRCGEEAHRPVSCGTVRAWLAKNASDSETANWVVAHTKRCPKCRRPIEKNHGCNHMTCGAPCRHQFCWLCFDPWDNHRGCTRYDYRQRQVVVVSAAGAGNEEEEARRRQAKASLDRYLYHYERWEGNGKSLQKAIADADELERSELERMARLVDVPAMELGFLTEAYRQIADGRRVLRWAHAYAYFLFLDMERDGAAKRDLFDDLQSQANRWLECLHGCAELERKELFGGGGADGDGGESTTVVVAAVEAFRAYKEKVANLTGVTRKFMGNLVKAFKTNLPEVVVTPAFDLKHIVNGPTIDDSQTAGVGGIISTATVRMEQAAMLPMISGPAGFWRATPTSNVDSQGMSTAHPSSSSLISQQTNIIANDGVQEHRPIRNPVQQPVRPGGHHGCLPSNLSQYPQMNSTSFGEATTSRGRPNTGAGTPLQVHMPKKISNLLCDREKNILSRGVTLRPSVTFSMSAPGQPIGSFDSNTPTAWDNSDIAASSSQPNRMAMDQQAGMSPLSSAMNVPIGMHPNDQQPPPKYVKIWEGTLSGQRQGQPVFISKLESWSGTLSKTIAADWPETMQIVHLIAQEHMNKKQYVGKTDFLIFRTLNQHGFLGQLQEKKLCAVIQLPSQTLLLSMSDKAGRMIGTLFPENMVMFKPEVLTQPSPLQQEKLQQQQELCHQQLQLQQQQHQNIQQLIEQKQMQQRMQLQQQQHQNIEQLIEQKQMQQMQQRMQVSTQNLPMQQQRLHQQQLQHLQQLQHQQQQLMQQQLWLQQMQHEQQLRQQIQQQMHRQQHMHQMQPQQQLLPQMVGTELASDDDGREDWVTGAGQHAQGSRES